MASPLEKIGYGFLYRKIRWCAPKYKFPQLEELQIYTRFSGAIRIQPEEIAAFRGLVNSADGFPKLQQLGTLSYMDRESLAGLRNFKSLRQLTVILKPEDNDFTSFTGYFPVLEQLILKYCGVVHDFNDWVQAQAGQMPALQKFRLEEWAGGSPEWKDPETVERVAQDALRILRGDNVV